MPAPRPARRGAEDPDDLYGTRIYRVRRPDAPRSRKLAKDVGEGVPPGVSGPRLVRGAAPCGAGCAQITRHRCLDELKCTRPTAEIDLDDLVGPSEPSESSSRVEKRRALERCRSGCLSLREQLLMRFHLGSRFAEIDDWWMMSGTVQVGSRGSCRGCGGVCATAWTEAADDEGTAP